MKLIEAKYEIIPQAPGLEGIYKQIELAGRVCYKSEDKICEGSAKKMVDFLVKREHGSPLEHGTVYLTLKWWQIGKKLRYLFNKYSKIRKFKYVSSNYRVLVENEWLDDLKYLCEPTKYHEKRYTVRLNCSIGVSRELNRHRVNSICEQSTRYCNYSLDKFGKEVTFVLPQWVIDRTNYVAETYDPLTNTRRDYLMDMPILEAVTKHMVCEDRAIANWVASLEDAESSYFYLLIDECGLKPQEARGVLPLDTATEVFYTAFASDWKHLFKLRTAPGAHPDVRAIICPLEAEFKLNNYI